MDLKIFDVEHGACALIQAPNNGRIALIDCGTNTTTGWTPAAYIRNTLGRQMVDYLSITNADQDHYANLAALRREISITTLIKNPSLTAVAFEHIKRQSGSLSDDALAYKEMLQSYTGAVSTPFDHGMGGITLKSFYNNYPRFTDTNNLSCATFVNYRGFQILFPGDLEEDGWLALLEQDSFRTEVQRTTILVASHHGRRSGYCAALFQQWGPQAVVISDKPLTYETQQTVPQYQNCLSGDGINVVGCDRKRHVLTTRRDGCIHFKVGSEQYSVYTH